MTVASALNRKTFTGDASTTSFGTSPVVFFESDNLTVYVVTTATGAATTLTEGTHYTVSGGGTPAATGTVSLAGGSSPYGAPTAAQSLVIVRDIDILQEVDFVQNDPSDADVAEAALDRITMIAQQIDADVNRSFRLADSDVSGASTTLPTPEASKIIGWNDDADELVNYSASDFDVVLTAAHLDDFITSADMDASIQALFDGTTAETAPAAGDLILVSDVSLTPDDGRKMTLANALKVINDLTAETAPAVDDVLALYDTDGAATDKITLANFFKVINGLTEDTTPDVTADFVVTYDDSATGAKKVKPSNLGAKTIGAVTSLTSTSVTVTGIPAGVRRVTINIPVVSFDNTAALRVQIGPVGGVESSGYLGAYSSCIATAAAAAGTSGIDFTSIAAAGTFRIKIVLDLIEASTNTWLASINHARTDSADAGVGVYLKPLAGALERVLIGSVAGTASFDGSSQAQLTVER